MSMTAGQVINDAINNAHPFIAEWARPRGPLLRRLAAQDNKIVNMYLSSSPEQVSTVGTDITVVASTNATGYSLFTPARGYRNFKWVDPDNNVMPITIVDDTHFDVAQQHPSGIIRGATFFPADPEFTRWARTGTSRFFLGNGDKIAYDYIPDPTTLAALTTALVSPDDAYQFLVSDLRMHILIISGNAPSEILQEAVNDREEQFRSLQQLTTLRNDTHSSFGLPRDAVS
jgi:hypothetical protein